MNTYIKKRADMFISYILVIIISTFVAFPMLWMLVTSLKPENELYNVPPKWIPQNITFEWYKMALESGIMRNILNSFIVSLGTAFLTMFFALFAAYAVARFNFKGVYVFLLFILIGQMLPQILYVIPFFDVLSKIGMLNSYFALMIVYMAFTLPLSVWMLKGFLDNIPKELEEAALIDGCGRIKMLFKIILPLALPGLIAVGIYTFLLSWSELMLALTFINQPEKTTLPVALAMFVGEYQTRWGVLMASSFLATIPTLLIFAFLQKHFVKGITAGAVKE